MTKELAIQSFSELSAEAEAAHANQRKRNPFSREWLTLTGGGYDYNIHRSRLDTPHKVLHFLHHLSEKTWITVRDLHDVMAYAKHYNGIDPYGRSA